MGLRKRGYIPEDKIGAFGKVRKLDSFHQHISGWLWDLGDSIAHHLGLGKKGRLHVGPGDGTYVRTTGYDVATPGGKSLAVTIDVKWKGQRGDVEVKLTVGHRAKVMLMSAQWRPKEMASKLRDFLQGESDKYR